MGQRGFQKRDIPGVIQLLSNAFSSGSFPPLANTCFHNSFTSFTVLNFQLCCWFIFALGATPQRRILHVYSLLHFIYFWAEDQHHPRERHEMLTKIIILTLKLKKSLMNMRVSDCKSGDNMSMIMIQLMYIPYFKMGSPPWHLSGPQSLFRDDDDVNMIGWE